MISGLHTIIYTKDAGNVRAFFRDTLKFPAVDVGHGWLIFALPPAELGIHPAEGEAHSELYLMCDNIQATMKDLAAKGVEFTGPVAEEGWGLTTAIKLPGGGELGIYQPRHPTALGLGGSAAPSSSKRKPSKAKSPARKAKAAKPRRKASKRRKR
ncbi:MAG TPA: VOC family protein [Candidatus Acidoferrum sp.]|nr:VOC family protein [Candidatus Acidoferrum sp.]